MMTKEGMLINNLEKSGLFNVSRSAKTLTIDVMNLDKVKPVTLIFSNALIDYHGYTMITQS